MYFLIGIPTCRVSLSSSIWIDPLFAEAASCKTEIVFSLEGESRHKSTLIAKGNVVFACKVYKDERVLITNSHYLLGHSLSHSLFLGFSHGKKSLLIRLTGAAAKRSSGH